MSNYVLHAYKGEKILFPNESWNAEDYLERFESHFMTESLQKDNDGKIYRRYRFRTCKPTRFLDTLEYDLRCPHCNGDLRLCDLPLDSTHHGLYKCRRCDDK